MGWIRNNNGNDEKSQDRKKVREVLCGAFEKFEGELAGKFYDLGTLSDEDRNMLLGSGFLFQIPKTTNLLWHAGAAKNWPTVRKPFSGWQTVSQRSCYYFFLGLRRTNRRSKNHACLPFSAWLLLYAAVAQG